VASLTAAVCAEVEVPGATLNVGVAAAGMLFRPIVVEVLGAFAESPAYRASISCIPGPSIMTALVDAIERAVRLLTTS
jgi:hypothetical protein